jgi:hypothetical protein
MIHDLCPIIHEHLLPPIAKELLKAFVLPNPFSFLKGTTLKSTFKHKKRVVK